MTCRPAYQPHVPHTTWGSLAELQRGHTLRGGASSRHADARRLRLLALEVFFLGTAIGRCSSSGPGGARRLASRTRLGGDAPWSLLAAVLLEAQVGQRAPAVVGDEVVAAVDLVAVGAARRA